MNRFKVLNVVGARPNFMKIAPIMREMSRHDEAVEPVLVHTGQHYDHEMSGSFFLDLDICEPDVYLGVGSGSHAEQTAKIMVEFEKVCLREKPDLVLVVGDVNSTLACSITASKLCIPVAHVEAGLRSFDRIMPEEINRMVTDALSDYLFTTCEDANENLCREGIPQHKIHFVGNVMVDTLLQFRDKALKESAVLSKMGLVNDSRNGFVSDYAVVTLHRPSNVDDKNRISNILQALEEITEKLPILFPVHPRTRKQLRDFNLCSTLEASGRIFDAPDKVRERGLYLLNPLGYLDFLSLMNSARLVLTDSGGIQEETTVLGIPCLTLRDNTERPVTVSMGTNSVIGTEKEKIIRNALRILEGGPMEYKLPPLWDGKAARRIIEFLVTKLT